MHYNMHSAQCVCVHNAERKNCIYSVDFHLDMSADSHLIRMHCEFANSRKTLKTKTFCLVSWWWLNGYRNVCLVAQLYESTKRKWREKKKVPPLFEQFPFLVFVFLSFEWTNISLARIFQFFLHFIYQLKSIFKNVLFFFSLETFMHKFTETIEAYEIILYTIK